MTILWTFGAASCIAVIVALLDRLRSRTRNPGPMPPEAHDD